MPEPVYLWEVTVEPTQAGKKLTVWGVAPDLARAAKAALICAKQKGCPPDHVEVVGAVREQEVDFV